MKDLAPVLLFTYRRLEHTKKTLQALRANYLASESKLFVFIDGPKNEADIPAVESVREYVKSINGFAQVHIFARDKNIGLSNSLISGITKIINEFGKAIIVEDDIYTSPYFLNYMNDALELYENDEKVYQVDACLLPVEREDMPQSFFMTVPEIWGWGTWRRAWKNFEPDAKKLLDKIHALKLERKFDCDGAYPVYVSMLKAQLEGRIDSWAVRWYAANLILEKLSLSPGQTFTNNTGVDGSGTNCGKARDTSNLNGELAQSYEPLKRIPIEINQEAWEAVKAARIKLLISRRGPLWKRILRKTYNSVKKLLGR